MQRLDLQFFGRTPTEAELDACSNCLRMSKHTRVRLMPNHHLNEKGNLTGFIFTCSKEDKTAVLPMSEQMFSATAVYEVKCHSTANFHRDAMHIISHVQESRAHLLDLVAQMRSSDLSPALVDCICEQAEASEGYAIHKVVDQRAWADGVPGKMGIYHTFSCSYVNDQREHHLFITWCRSSCTTCGSTATSRSHVTSSWRPRRSTGCAEPRSAASTGSPRR